MFGSAILEIAIGLVLFYLLMSLVLTAVQEAIEGMLQTRALDLERAVNEILRGETDLVEAVYKHPLVSALYPGNPNFSVIKDGKVERRGGRNMPSYIPRGTFAAALLDVLGSAPKLGGKGARTAIDCLDDLAGGDLTRKRREIEAWYDGAMDRASGWFKRRTQVRLFVLGLLVSLALNVNSIGIAQYLAINPQQRELVAALAQQAAGQPAAPDEAAAARFEQELLEIGLPIGWNDNSLKWMEQSLTGSLPQSMLGGLALVLGYLITAFAVMLGAPFWFDLLNKFMVIRSTVKPTEKSPDEPSEG